MPLVSIIIINYNGRKYLTNCLYSSLNSKFKDFEIIIIDNGSSDGSADFGSITYSLYLMLRDRDVHWLYHPLMCFLQTMTYLFWAVRLPDGRKALIERIFRREDIYA